MPTLTVVTPKYRRHKASGQAIVTIQCRDHYLGPSGTMASHLEYDRLIGEWLAAGRPTVAQRRSEVTVVEVVAAFWKHAKAYYLKHGRPTGTAENFKPVLTLLKSQYGTRPAADFGPLALKALQATMVQLGQSRRYINENTHRIRQVFKWAASEELITPLIPQSLGTVAGLRKGHCAAHEPQPVLPVADATVEATLPHLPSMVADMVRLQRLTGARSGEIIQLRPADVDRSSDVWRFVPQEHKTENHGRQRAIFIGPKAQQILLPFLLRDAEAFCFSPAESVRKQRRRKHETRKTPLNCGNIPGSNRKKTPATQPKEAYTNDSYRRAIVRACELAFGMPRELRYIPKTLDESERRRQRELATAWRAKHVWPPHQLRHSAATEIRQRFGLEAAQVSLGHARVDVTQIYAEKNMALAAQVAREVG